MSLNICDLCLQAVQGGMGSGEGVMHDRVSTSKEFQMKELGFTTGTLHSDRAKPIEHGAVHKPIHNSAAFGFADINDLVRIFQGDQAGFA